MDQEKIGRFISRKRKEKQLAQEQLSEKLGVSTNAVSKWERGICLMDMSLLKPLSDILDVSINEILSGEYISEEELKNKVDENIINLTELYDLKAIKQGTIAFTGILLFFLVYFAKKNIDTLPRYEDDSYLELEEFDNRLMEYGIKKITHDEYAKACDLDRQFCDRFIRIIDNN